jgi:protein MpaA
VRARAADGETDPTPARRLFRVVRQRVTFGHSVEGDALVAVRIGNPAQERKALVVGEIHGDEHEGREIVRELRRRWANLTEVEIWTVVTVNPDGHTRDTRKNARGVDLNRNFSYDWMGGVPSSSGYYPGPGPFSEPESRAVRDLARRVEPRVSIWYHQPWGVVLLPCEGPGRIQRRYARLSGLPPDRCRVLHGTAVGWQNHVLGGTAFVVELLAGELSDVGARRHARAAARVAATGAR